MGFKTINDFPESTNPSGDWFALIDDGTGCYKKVKLSNLPGGGGGGSTTTTTTSTSSSSTSSTTSTSTTTSCTATDSDAQAFITSAEITSCSVKVAINTLVINLKASNLWNKMKAIYPFVGGSVQSANAVNLKNPGTFNLTFNGTGWIFDISGITPNGSSTYAETNLVPFTEYASPNSISLGFYCMTNDPIISPTYHYQIGAYESGGTNPETGMFFYEGGTGNKQRVILGDQQAVEVNYTSFNGFHVASRTSSSSLSYYRNGVQLGTTNTNVVSGNLPNYENFIFAANVNGSPGSFSTEKLSFVFIGDGLNSGEVTTFNTIVNTFQTSLGRNVV